MFTGLLWGIAFDVTFHYEQFKGILRELVKEAGAFSRKHATTFHGREVESNPILLPSFGLGRLHVVHCLNPAWRSF